ncbi:E3 ubiquitin-protein ligase listerin [Elysia marginata]|uniref:E3 ubiquitin-protein ligase listerin n=1 Tax=Elysia marginata TaxID=1093978 RepID=A0AAV4FGN1_9GAST|nr:E3 ubiquitin-protein ligase listerin [Elysia marginata]
MLQPSSSSQAAQLLAASGHAATGFIGFSNQPAFVPVSETFDEAESALDGDFRLVLRKLSKRDTVTKIKALQEFVSLCSSKEEDTVKAIVPFWPRIYNKVAIDVDHKVRELSQKATAALASRTGKAMAPHLKSIMGMWVVSMCDTYPTVASAANLAFTARFPGAKQGEAIRFCLSEIVECLSKNITSHNKQTLSDPQTTSDEDMEAKYQRVITSSLQGMRKVLKMLPPESVTTLMSEHMKNLLESSSFWKHAKSSVQSVKGGMLSLLSAICQLCPSASIGTISKISPFVFSYLSCADPSIISYVWEAVLSIVSAHTECWQHVNWQKAVWPKLKSVLESGCFGQAGIVAPCLLPFLSKIPEISFARFFESFRLGLIEDSVLNSPSEVNALVKSLQECMQYAIKKLINDKRTLEIRDLLLDQMLTVVQGSLTEPRASLARTELYSNLSALLSAASDIDTEKCFWSDLSAFIIVRLQVEFEMAKNSNQPSPSTGPELFERLKLLMKGLIFEESATDTRRKERVKFISAEESEGTSSIGFFKLGKDPRTKERAKLSTFAEGFIGDILVAVFRMASVEETTSQFISLFSQLVVLDVPVSAVVRLNSRTDAVSIHVMEDLGVEPGHCLTRNAGKAVIDKLVSQLSSADVDVVGEANHYKEFVVSHLLPLLFYAESRLPDSEELQYSTVTALFSFLLYVDDSTALEILSSTIEAVSEPFMTCQMIEYTVLMSKAIPACERLSEGPSFAKHVKQLAERAAGDEKFSSAETSLHVWKMLISVVSSMDSSYDLHVPQPCLDAIMTSCVCALCQLFADNSNSQTTQQSQVRMAMISLAEALLSKPWIVIHSWLGDLVINLLRLLLPPKQLGKDEVSNIEHLWMKGFGLVLHNKCDLEIRSHLNQVCGIIQDSLRSSVRVTDSVGCVKRVVTLFLSSIISPWDEHSEGNTIISRINALTLDSEVELKDVDLPAVSAVVDTLLIQRSPHMQDFQQICDYLYISGDFHTAVCDSRLDTKRNLQLPIETEVMSSLYNMSVLEKLISLHQRVSHEGESAADTHIISDTPIKCLKDLCGKFVLLSAAKETGKYQLSELSSCVSDLCLGLMNCLSNLTLLELSNFVDYALMEASATPTSLEIQGLVQLFKIITEKGQISKKKAFLLESNILKMKFNFVKNCQVPTAVSSEVIQLFDDTGVSESTVCKAFSQIFNELLMASDESCDKIPSITLCLAGFLNLTAGYNLLKENAKLELFQHLMTTINGLKDKNIHLLNSSDSMPVPVPLLELNVCVARSLKGLGVAGNDQYWEFTLCSLVEWIQFLSENREKLCSDAHMQALAVSVFELSFTVAHTFSAGSNKGAVSSEVSFLSGITEKAKIEWSEFFAEGLFSPLLPMFASLATSSERWNPAIWSLLQAPLSSAVSFCPDWLVLSHQLPPHLTASDTSSLSDSLKSLLNHLCPLLMSRERCVEVAAYLILRTVVGEIAKQDSETGEIAKEGKEEKAEDEEAKSPPEALIVQIEGAAHFLECLKVVQVDDHIVMDPGTEERSQAMGYLLAWRLLLFLFKSSQGKIDVYLTLLPCGIIRIDVCCCTRNFAIPLHITLS